MCVGVQKGQVEEQPSALAPFLPLCVSEFDLTWYVLSERANKSAYTLRNKKKHMHASIQYWQASQLHCKY